jgi:GNAT superfamily N-acetyltransferase
MRLTNVAHLRLPFGRLMGYDVTVTDRPSAVPVSFDQRRHVGAGARPGSWMALSFTVPGRAPLDELAQAWLAVISRHGTLSTVFTPGPDGVARAHSVDIGAGEWVEHQIAEGQAVNDAVRDVLDRACSPYERPSHRLCALETQAETTVVIGSDHAHVDMWSMLVIARDLLEALRRIRRGETPGREAARDFSEHTRALARRPKAPDDVRERWADILAASGDVMPRFPLELGDSLNHAERVEVRDVLDRDDAAAFAVAARSEGVSTLSLAVSAMTAVTLELSGEGLRAVFPVHSRYEAAWHDSVGWFITNSVIECRDPAPAAASAAVREAIRLGSWPLEDLLTPWGGMPEAPGMFAISWLDLRRLPVRIDSRALNAEYVGATVRTDGIMLWFILDESGLHLRCRYPDTPAARRNVGAWLDSLVARLRQLASSSVAGVLEVGGRQYRVGRAERTDVPGIVHLLNADEVGRVREVNEIERYEAAFDLVARDRANYLAVVRSPGGSIVGSMQLTVIPGLSRGGATRLQIEALRVAPEERGHGLGSAMLGWAHDHGRAHGAGLAQVDTDEARLRARDFYARNGYEMHHVGLKREL